MRDERIGQRENILVRRLVLDPGDAMPWHTDPHWRVTTVLPGDALRLEYQDDPDHPQHLAVHPGLAEWAEPSARVHRAVNVGPGVYEEVTVFLLDTPDAITQPECESEGAGTGT